MSHQIIPRAGAESSSDTSPVEPRDQPTRFASITQHDDGEEAERTGTIRRNRPPAISTNTGTGTGTDSPLAFQPIVYQPVNVANLDCPESMTAISHAERSLSSLQRTPTQDTARQRNIVPSSQQRTHSPEAITPTLKPKLPRRASLSRRASQAPHKGQEFSVDDDPDEYESDYVDKKSVARAASGYAQSLRRQPSTLRRRGTAQPTSLPRVESQGEDEEEQDVAQQKQPPPMPIDESLDTSGEEGTIQVDTEDADDDDDDEEDSTSDAESFTLKDRQQAINDTHPFGIRIWKPALYKKHRSVEKTAEGDIHSSPGGRVNQWLWTFNALWTVLFGWWLSLAALVGAVACLVLGFMPGALEYGHVLWDLSFYLLYPFGKFVKLEQDEAYAEEDEGEGRSITEYEQWQNGDIEDGRLFFGPLTARSLIGRRRASMESADETDSLLGRTRRGAGSDESGTRAKRRLFGRGEWTVGRVIYFVSFYFLVAPLLLLASGICWFLVFWIPMGKVTLLLFDHLRRHPLALSFHSDSAYSRGPSSPSSSVLLCTYRAVGTKYWKYTIDGTNIFLINMLGVVLFAIFDYWVLDVALGLDNWLVHPGFVFALALFSIIPLAYFIGQAVASISAQSSMGVGAAINAFFSTVVEVFLYCVALNQGKGQLVEGSIIGSIFAGILFLPGLSMCFGAIKRKTQRFNVKSAGVTSTMLLFATIAAFGPTLFYQIYGSHELNCHACILTDHGELDSDCRRCFFSQVPAIHDLFFIEAVQPYCWFAAVLLFLSYIIGLWFTLRTHAAVIWNSEIDEKKPQHHQSLPSLNGSINQHMSQSANGPTRKHSASIKGTVGRNEIRDSQLYKRILGQSLNQAGLGIRDSRQASIATQAPNGQSPQTPFIVPPKTGDSAVTTGDAVSHHNMNIAGLSEEDNAHLVRQVAEMAATAATVAARDATTAPRKASHMSHSFAHHSTPSKHSAAPTTAFRDHEEAVVAEVPGVHAEAGGHDAPNWSRMKSAVILLGATVLYAIIAEILVNTVDVVLESVDISEKFLGITLFALVPNTTEFLNAISFAMNGNIALSMEIGSAYALQVCLLQIPALVLFSAIHSSYIDPAHLADHTFNLIFPQWDMVTVILCVFLLSYVYGEGKSNYFKGSILVLTYLVIVVGFYVSGYASDMDIMGVRRFDTPAPGQQHHQQSFKTIGRARSGRAY
ncbi:MAG: hypothetical protein Q9168_006025 [Polycauliona sp. 1 TL-2023]